MVWVVFAGVRLMLVGGLEQDVAGAVTQLPVLTLLANVASQGETSTVYSGVRFGADGNIYKLQSSGGYSVVGQWLLNGTASDYYVARTVVTGSLVSDSGNDVQLNTDRTYYVTDTTANGSSVQASVSFSITNSGGGTVYSGPRTYSFSAFLDTGA